MKHSIWPVAILALGIISDVPEAKAQEFGIIGGLNIASLGGGVFSQQSSRDCLVVGGFARWDLVGGLAVQPEVLFSMKGASGYPAPGIAPSWDASYVISRREILDYVDVPVLLRINLFSIPLLPASFDIFAGPDFAFLMYSISKMTVVSAPGTQELTTGGPGGFNLFDFNVAVGGGPEFNLGPTTLGLQLRYTFGTGRIFTNAGDSWVNDVWSIMGSASF